MKIIISWRGDDAVLRTRTCVSPFGASELVRSLTSWGMTDITSVTETIPSSAVVINKIKQSYITAGMSAHNADRRIRQMITKR